MASSTSKQAGNNSSVPSSCTPEERYDFSNERASNTISASQAQPVASDVEAQNESAGDVTKAPTKDRPYTTFTGPQKALLVLISTLGACFSGFTGNIYFPAIDTISRALDVSVSKVNLTITTYMIFQGIAPSFISAIADEYGRRPAYMIGFTVYILANLGLGLNNSYAGLMVLRCVQSCGSSGLVTLSQGTIADIITSAERGKYISITAISSVLAPSVGPIAGGLLAGNLGWHSIFWFLLIASGVYFIPLVLFLPETGRKIVGDGSIMPPKWNRCLTDLIRNRKKAKDIEKDQAQTPEDQRSLSTLPASAGDSASPSQSSKKTHQPLNPFASLTIIADPETALLLTTIGIIYAGFYAVSTSLTVQFARIYHLNSTLQGLLFLPQAVGSIFAAIFNTRMIDARYRVQANRAGVPVDRARQVNILTSPMNIERARVEIAIPMIAVSCISVIIYGWLLKAQVSIAGPIVMLVLIGFTALSAFSVLSVLVIDLHRSRSATASAANNLVRCLLGAGASAVVNPIIEGIGLGWCFTLVGLLGLTSLPMLVVCAVYGRQMRQRRGEREKRRAEDREARALKKEGVEGDSRRQGWRARIFPRKR